MSSSRKAESDMGSGMSRADQEPMETNQDNDGDMYQNGQQGDQRGHRQWENFNDNTCTSTSSGNSKRPSVNRNNKPEHGNLIQGQNGGYDNYPNRGPEHDGGGQMEQHYEEQRKQFGPPTERPNEHQRFQDKNGQYPRNHPVPDPVNWQQAHTNQDPRRAPRFDDKGRHMDSDTTRPYPEEYTNQERWGNKQGYGDTSPRKHNGKGYDAAWEQQRGEEKYYREQQRQHQQQLQQQRSAEASKQMLYGVYGNVMTILEEHERRLTDRKMPKSKIAIPDQSRKKDEDVQAIVQTQLLLFETQSRVCPPEVRAAVNDELRRKTILWAAVRSEQRIRINETDDYLCKLYEVLVKGKTRHEFMEKPLPPPSAETMKEVLPHIMAGKHEAGKLDEDFKNNRDKKATAPETRRSDADHALMLGAYRIADTNKKLEKVVLEDMAFFQKQGPESIL